MSYELSPMLTLAVLGAALLHATWNAMVKSAEDKLMDTALICIGGSAVAFPFLFVVVPPAPAAWPWLAASMVIHVGYFFCLAGAYRAGDLSHGYPIMRGIAPLIVAAIAFAWLGDSIPFPVWAGILLICTGVLSLGFSGSPTRAVLLWALANGAIIAAYTLVDAAGVRASGSPAGYVVWMFVLDCVPFGLIVWLQRGKRFAHYVTSNFSRALAGGVCSATAYGIAIWAMAHAPVAAVAALRETSVVFAALIGAWILREGHVRERLSGAVVVAAGIATMKL